jgi:hypothetical protein
LLKFGEILLGACHISRLQILPELVEVCGKGLALNAVAAGEEEAAGLETPPSFCKAAKSTCGAERFPVCKSCLSCCSSFLKLQLSCSDNSA